MNLSSSNGKKHQKACNRCDLGYIVKDHIISIMQVLTNELPDYNFRLQTTKCLNTAVMLMLFFLGKRGLKIANYCDTRAVIQRHKNGTDKNDLIMKDLKKQIFSKKEKSRVIYYILLTDGYFPNSISDLTNNINTQINEQIYFPGHVFILEKMWDENINEHFYYFYQSYINKYTLNQHISLNNGLKISLSKAKRILDNLESILKAQTWNDKNVDMWKDMTFTNSSKFINSHSKENFFLCFKKAKTDKCLENIKTFFTKIQNKLEKVPNEKLEEIYGDFSLYDDKSIALTNKQMRQEVNTLLKKITI
jgi:hypothetical protein